MKKALHNYIIIIMIASFMRVSFMLVFHQSKGIGAIKRILLFHHYVCIRVLSWTCVFLATAMHALSVLRCVWEWRRQTVNCALSNHVHWSPISFSTYLPQNVFCRSGTGIGNLRPAGRIRPANKIIRPAALYKLL